MAKYQLSETGVLDQETGWHTPDDPRNRRWRDYQEWLGEGNTPDPIPEPPSLTAAQALEQSDVSMIRAIDWMLQYLVQDAGIIPLADIPPALKQLYLERKTQREAP